MCLVPQTPAVRVVSLWEELPQRFVHYNHRDRQRGSWLKMASSPVGHCVLLLLWRISLSWGSRSGLCWEGIATDNSEFCGVFLISITNFKLEG